MHSIKATPPADQQNARKRRSSTFRASANSEPATNGTLADHQALFAPEFKGEPAAAHRTDCRTEHHGAYDPFLRVRSNLEFICNKRQCASNYTDIQAKE